MAASSRKRKGSDNGWAEANGAAATVAAIVRLTMAATMLAMIGRAPVAVATGATATGGKPVRRIEMAVRADAAIGTAGGRRVCGRRSSKTPARSWYSLTTSRLANGYKTVRSLNLPSVESSQGQEARKEPVVWDAEVATTPGDTDSNDICSLRVSVLLGMPK